MFGFIKNLNLKVKIMIVTFDNGMYTYTFWDLLFLNIMNKNLVSYLVTKKKQNWINHQSFRYVGISIKK